MADAADALDIREPAMAVDAVGVNAARTSKAGAAAPVGRRGAPGSTARAKATCAYLPQSAARKFACSHSPAALPSDHGHSRIGAAADDHYDQDGCPAMRRIGVRARAKEATAPRHPASRNATGERNADCERNGDGLRRLWDAAVAGAGAARSGEVRRSTTFARILRAGHEHTTTGTVRSTAPSDSEWRRIARGRIV